MSEKQRALPLWMSNKNVKKKTTSLKSQRKGKAERVLFYCMNEAEVVEAAVRCLTSSSPIDQQISKKASNAREKVKKPLTSPKRLKQISEEKDWDCCDYPETTYVSETDLDVTEAETLPYTRSPEAERSHQNQRTVRNADAEAEGEQEKPTEDAAHQEDEALQLVRDIFFT